MAASKSPVLSHWYHFVENFSTSALDFYTAVEEAVATRGLPEDVSTERVTYKEGGVLSAKREYLRVKRERLNFDICAAPYGNGYFFSWWLAKRPYPALPWVLAMAFIGFVYLLAVLWALKSSLLAQTQMALTGQDPGGGSAIVWLLLLTPILIYVLGKAIQEEIFGPEEAVIETPVIGAIYVALFGPMTYYRLDTATMFQESVRRAVGEVIQGLFEEQGLKALAPEELKPQNTLLQR